MHFIQYAFLLSKSTKKKERSKEKQTKKEKGNLTRFKIVDIYDDIPCVCINFTTQIK